MMTTLEQLERRQLLAAAIEGGVLVARGSDANNTIELRRSQTDDVVVTIWQGSATPASQQVFDMDNFTGVLLDGLGGNDQLYYAGDRIVPGVTMNGGEGNDWLYGAFQSNAAESLVGGNGNDTLTGNGGPDTLLGEDGNDTLHIDGALDSAVYEFWGIPRPATPLTLDVLTSEDGLDVILAPGATTSFASVSGGTLIVNGTDGDDIIVANERVENTGSVTSVFFNGSLIELDASQFATAEIFGQSGNDTIVLSRSIRNPEDPRAHFSGYGNDGNDHFYVDESFRAHTFFGGAGDDIAESAPTHDIIPNFVSGGSGSDTLVAYRDVDLRTKTDIENGAVYVGPLYGNGQANKLISKDRATIYGGDGNDTLIGEEGTESILNAEAGDDRIIIEDQRFSNTVDGGSGIDTLQGGSDNDDVTNVEVFSTDPTAPTIQIVDRILTASGTGGGDEITIERSGIDNVLVRVNGLAAHFDMNDFDGVLLRGFGGADELFVKQIISNGTLTRSVTLEGGAGHDTLIGSNGREFMYGGDGNDAAYGIGFRDVILGEAGEDTLFGGSAGDSIDGGEDDDVIWSNDNGNTDVVDGGSGDDTAHVDSADRVANVETTHA